MNNSFSLRMVELRNERQLSQKDVASQLGISQALLSHYEKGIRECGLEFLCRAANFYDVSCDYLLGVIDTRRSFHEEFEAVDLKFDSEFRTSTLYRAATMLNDTISDEPSGKSESIKQYFALTLYRLAISASQAGYIPKNWINQHNDFSSTFSEVVINQILKDISQNPKGKTEKQMDEPLCVKTVISTSEQLFRKDIDAYLSNYSETD